MAPSLPSAPRRTLRRGTRGGDVAAFKDGLNARLTHIPGGHKLRLHATDVFDDDTLQAWRKVRWWIGLPDGHAPTIAAQRAVRWPRTRSPQARRRARARRAGGLAGKPRIVTARQLGLEFQWVWGGKGFVTMFGGHYSGGPAATSIDDTIAKAVSFHGFHRSLGWGGGSYEYVVGPGVIVCLNPTGRKSAAVAGMNTGMTGVCVPGTTGDTIDPLTRATLAWLFANAHTRALPAEHRMPRPIRSCDCRGHKEFPGQSTSCPGLYLPTYKELFAA